MSPNLGSRRSVYGSITSRDIPGGVRVVLDNVVYNTGFYECNFFDRHRTPRTASKHNNIHRLLLLLLLRR